MDTLLRAGDFSLNDEHDKQMPAIDVFSSSIRYFVDKTLEQINEQGHVFKTEDVKWVLTVPAIWDNAAKQFMRKAAENAGIPDGNLVLALEPEAASLCCRYLKNDKSVEQTSALNVNSRYVVLDAGGGTADIVTHEITANGSLKELNEPIGGDWGGVQVDWAYHRLLIHLFGAPILRLFREKEYHEFIDMMKEFEAVKLCVSGAGEDEVVIKIPPTLVSIFEQTTGVKLVADINQSNYKKKVEYVNGRLILQAKLFRSLFYESIYNINNAVRNLLEKSSVSGTDTILLVGGFAESALLKRSIKTAFKERKVIIPEHPSLAIVKGAVLFGHRPDLIQTRKCNLTYGISAVREYIPGDPEELRLSNRNMVGSVFDKIAEKGESLTVGTARSRTYSTVNENQYMLLMFYTSTLKNPKYISNSEFLGDLLIDGLSSDSRSVFVETVFGDTELMVHAMEPSTNKSFNATFNFLRRE